MEIGSAPGQPQVRRILAVDDEPRYLEIIRFNLEAAGYRVACAASGEEALDALTADEPDLIVLDVMLPGIDGWEVLRGMRRAGNQVPVLFLTARDDVDDRVKGLELGADDYLVKPFRSEELLARVEAVLRRTYGARQPMSALVRAGPDVLINTASHEVFVRGENVALRPAEYALLVLLAENGGQPLSVEAIATALGIDNHERGRDRVKWHVWKLRQAVESDPRHPTIVITEAGRGYRISA